MPVQHSTEDEILIEQPGMGLFGNSEVDSRLVPERAFVNGRNVRFYANASKVRKSDSVSLFDTTTGSEAIRQLMKHIKLDGQEQLVRVTLTKVYSGFAPATDITGTALSGSLDDIVTWDQYEDILFFTDKDTRPQRWDGVAATVSNAGGVSADFRAQIVRAFKNHLLYFNILDTGVDAPWRMVYSATGTPEVFTGATSGTLDFVDVPGEITAAEVHEDAVLVFKNKSVHRVFFVGLPDNFSQEIVSAEDGTLSPRSAIKVGPYVYYVGNYNFYRIANSPEPIGDPIFKDFWLTLVDLAKRKRIFAYHRADLQEIVWRAQTVGAAQPDIEFVFNYEENTWSIRDCDHGTSFVRVRLSTANDTWDGGPATTWDQASGGDSTYTWDDPLVTLAQEHSLYSQNDGEIYSYLGTNAVANGACNAYVETRIFHLGGLTPARVIRIPLIAQGTGSMRISARVWDDERATTPPYTQIATYDLSNTQRKPWVDCRLWGRLCQLKFENNASTDDWQMEMYGLKFIAGQGER